MRRHKCRRDFIRISILSMPTAHRKSIHLSPMNKIKSRLKARTNRSRDTMGSTHKFQPEDCTSKLQMSALHVTGIITGVAVGIE